MATPEQAPSTGEKHEILTSAEARAEELREKIEQGAELGVESTERSAEKARAEAMENALSVEAGSAEKARKEPSRAPSKAKRRGSISKQEKEASFRRHMKQVQAEMSPPARVFSKFIHNKAVERTSEVVGGTVARPNAILAGAVVAFVFVLVVYLIAKHFGYVLSGFETIAAFIAGWLIGILYDYFRVLVTGKR